MTRSIDPSAMGQAFPRLPPQPISTDVLREHYLRPGESTAEDVFDRVARALASVEKPELRAEYERRFRSNLEAGAIGAGRIMGAAGTELRATLISCFVQPIGDGASSSGDEDDAPGLERALHEAMETMRWGGGVGYDFSQIRPSGAAPSAAGPCCAIETLEQACAGLEPAGSRRGAQMAVLRIDHPDIVVFVTAKSRPDRWRHFNLSVGVSDAFIDALHNDRDWALVHPSRPGAEQLAQGARRRADGQWIYRTLRARDLWETIMRSAYDFAEPGVLFLDRIAADNNLRALETITATNPCVSGDTWVMTDTGARRVHDLIGQRFSALVNGQAYRVERPGFVFTGIRPVWALQTHEGQCLRLTAGHRLKRLDSIDPHGPVFDWVPLRALLPGDRIARNDDRAKNGWAEREPLTATVRSLQPCGEAPVYDVTVPDVHAFVANGLLVHNCGEQPLPAYGCCDLGPIILPRFVRHPFGHGGEPAFDFDGFARSVTLQVRALDNVLDLTEWPLPQQAEEARAKRRIGVGFTGLGDALVMLGLPYDGPEGREMAGRIAACMRDAAYRSSISLAIEKAAFPLFDAHSFLAKGTFASRLPEDIQAAIKNHGLRNSHLLSIAPTGTVSLAFADNVSPGIEPVFAWTGLRRKREPDGTVRKYEVQDHAFRLYKALGGDPDSLPPAFVDALSMRPEDHIAMVKAVQPYIDGSISKTVNIAADYPYEDFKALYLEAWSVGLKGLATYRPNAIRGAVLEFSGVAPGYPGSREAARCPRV